MTPSEMTLEEIKDRLKTFEETALLDLLGLTSEDLVDRFSDLIEDDPEKFMREFEETERPTGEEE